MHRWRSRPASHALSRSWFGTRIIRGAESRRSDFFRAQSHQRHRKKSPASLAILAPKSESLSATARCPRASWKPCWISSTIASTCCWPRRLSKAGSRHPERKYYLHRRGDRYGLADLHQLRRVGRYKHRAYCYLLVDPHKHLSSTAARRLKAIEEFSQMGSGFAIADGDLELRGAATFGNTTERPHRHGRLRAVLRAAEQKLPVRGSSNLAAEVSVDVSIDLPCEAYIPPSHAPDMRLKIDDLPHRALDRERMGGFVRRAGRPVRPCALSGRIGMPPPAE